MMEEVIRQPSRLRAEGVSTLGTMVSDISTYMDGLNLLSGYI